MKGSVLSVMLKGLCVGSTMMVPGVSGGSMAMLLGIYDRLIYSVNSIRSVKSLLLLGTFSAGGFIGILLFSPRCSPCWIAIPCRCFIFLWGRWEEGFH